MLVFGSSLQLKSATMLVFGSSLQLKSATILVCGSSLQLNRPKFGHCDSTWWVGEGRQKVRAHEVVHDMEQLGLLDDIDVKVPRQVL